MRRAESTACTLFAVLVVIVASATAACGRADTGTVSAAPAATVTSAAAAETVPAMTHGDHNPHHGGVVYMYDDMHYEVVLDPGGHHRVYFTDSAREDLPASAASQVALTVERPQTAAETLTGVIDPQGESWLVDGTPVRQPDATVRVSFVAHGTQ